MGNATSTGRRAALAALAATIAPRIGKAASMDRLILIAPGPVGGGFDRMARAVAAALREAGLVRDVAIENFGIAGGAGALPRLLDSARGQGDVAMVTGAVMLGALAMSTGTAPLLRATPLARLAAEPLVMAVAAPAAEATPVALLARSGRPRIAGGPPGSADHRLVHAFAGARAAYLPNAGGIPAAEAVLGGQAEAVLTNLSDLAPMLAGGRLRQLARAEPGQPGDALPATDGNWRGLVAPPDLADAARARLVALAEALAGSAAWQAELQRRSWLPTLLAGPPFGAFLAEAAAALEAARDELRRG